MEPAVNNFPAQTRVHHPYSPSTLQAREACPKYEPKNEDSQASVAGTLQHDAVENSADDDRLKDHEAIAVAECLAYADRIAAKYPGGTIFKEEYLPIDDETIIVQGPGPCRAQQHFAGTTAGYPDFVVVSKDGLAAEVIDWKFGKWAVEDAENNLQGMSYLLGVLYRYPNLRSCAVHFVQPHRDEVDRHTFTLTRDFVEQTHLRIRVIVRRAEEARKKPNDFSMARPSTSACLFCALVGKCPKVTEFILRVSQKFAPMSLPENISPTRIHDPKDAALGIKLAQVAKAWAEAFRAAATDRALTRDDFIPEGYTLVKMQARKVLDARKLAQIAKNFLPADKAEDVEKLYDIPITKVEELIELVTPRGKKKHAVAAFNASLDESGAVDLGNPYGILRMSSKKESSQ